MGFRKNTRGIIGRGVGVGGMIVALVGCGDTEVNPKTPVAITSANAKLVVGKVAEMNDLVTGVGSSSGQAVAANLTSPSDTRAGPDFNLVRFALIKVQQVMADPPTASALAAQLIAVNDRPCDVSGSVSYTWNDKDSNNALSIDDEVSGSFSQCVDFPNTTVNGKFSFALHGIIGDPAAALSAWWLSATLNLDQLRVAEGNKSWTFNAKSLSLITSTPDSVVYTGSLSGATLDVTSSQDAITFGNFSYQFTDDQNTLAYTLQGSGDMMSTRIGGRVAFLTLTMFQGSGDDFPTAGSMKIKGAKNADATVSSVTFTAMGGNNVSLTIDTTGDDVADDTINTTWGELGV